MSKLPATMIGEIRSKLMQMCEGGGHFSKI